MQCRTPGKMMFIFCYDGTKIWNVPFFFDSYKLFLSLFHYRNWTCYKRSRGAKTTKNCLWLSTNAAFLKYGTKWIFWKSVIWHFCMLSFSQQNIILCTFFKKLSWHLFVCTYFENNNKCQSCCEDVPVLRTEPVRVRFVRTIPISWKKNYSFNAQRNLYEFSW